MKISFTILLFIGFLATSSVAAPAKAQELLQERLSLSLKNASLKTLLNAIEKKIDVAFSYQKEVVTSPERIDIEIRDEPLETVLSRYLSPRQISYKVLKNNTIVLAKNGSRPVGIAVPGGSPAAPNATHPLSSRLDTQTIDEVVKGRVTDEKGIPLPGVTITIQGSTRGTTSDASGRYSIAGLSPDDVLIFSSIGTETVKQPVGTRTIIDVVLRDEARTLDAVVVTALGFEAKRDQLGYATAKITGDNVGLSGEVGLIDALAGKASGVRIARTSGDPGASSQILIRGQSTITRGTDPLVVLDGVPISSDSRGETSTGTTQQSRLNDINADDIASVQVLKGASAAALWGTRAANGVIMITTKKGRAGTMSISVKSTLSIDEVSRFYDLQSTYGQGSNGVWSPTALRSWGDRLTDRTGGADVVNTAGPSFVGNTGQTYYSVTAKNSREDFLKKNYNAVLGRGQYIDNSVSISGGDSQSNYFTDVTRAASTPPQSEYISV